MEALKRRGQGASLRQIADALNVSIGAVQYMLKQVTSQGVNSPCLCMMDVVLCVPLIGGGS